MNILLTNDDGIFAPGLAAAYNRLKNMGRVTVVAPAAAKSGAGHSISLEPLVCEKLDITGKFVGYSVEGSPADCVKLALMELIDASKEPVDLVVSGLNLGANVGINVYYSGTVAAAVEAAFFGLPAVAISAAYEENADLQTSARYACGVLDALMPLKQRDVININIPGLSSGRPKGIRVVAQSTSGFVENYIKQRRGDGQTAYQLNGGDHKDISAADTDSVALAEGFITVTALHFDMTDYARNRQLEAIDWKKTIGRISQLE